MIVDEVKRVYFSCGDVAQALSINASKIRFYEREFDLNLPRSRAGKRKITVKQMGTLALIVRLTEHLSVKAARKVLANGTAQQVLALIEPDVTITVDEEVLMGTPMRIV